MPERAQASNVSQSLAATRRLRRIAYGCIGTPIVVTALIVIVNRLTGGGLAFFADPRAAWTHRFWFSLFGLMGAGVVLLLALLGRRCPSCGDGFFVTTGYRRSTTGGGRGGVNVFARRCMNCGLFISGR